MTEWKQLREMSSIDRRSSKEVMILSDFYSQLSDLYNLLAIEPIDRFRICNLDIGNDYDLNNGGNYIIVEG
jgi:hypothetical protein